jgi:hypothetical protein
LALLASSFGIDYIWNPGQAPATKPAFQTIKEALAFEIKPVLQTEVGKHSLAMIDDISYLNFVAPSFEKPGMAFGGPVHHSCGNFSGLKKSRCFFSCIFVNIYYNSKIS